MKIKQSFVTNSSSTGYILIGKRITRRQVLKDNWENIIAINREGKETYDFCPEDLYIQDEDSLLDVMKSCKTKVGDYDYFKYILLEEIRTNNYYTSNFIEILKELKNNEDISDYQLISLCTR